MSFKLSEPQQALGEKNKVNSSQNDNPHRTGSRGYLRKILEWEQQQEQLIQSGVTLQIDGWDPRSVRYLIARGASYNPDGSPSYRTPSAKDLAHRIQSAHEEVEQGIFTPNRENDKLTQALRRKEHPGRTRGTGLVPWGFSFKTDKDTYRSRSRKRAE
jgi:hypothetical protein